MTQGPDNNRPEPYFSDRQPGGGARPGSGAPGSPAGSAGGAAPGPGPGGPSGPRPGPAAASASPGERAGTGAARGPAGPAENVSPSAGPEGRQAPGDGGAPGPAGNEPRPAGGEPDPAGIEALEAELAEAQAKAAATHEQLLRALADNENLRRRTQEEILKARKFAIEAFAESLLPVIDSLELALKVEAPTVEAIREGVEATLRLMVSAFEKNQLVGIDPAGQKFDPNHHQAISMVPAESTDPPLPANHVATVLQKGYLINDRVLRPALVTVVQG